MRSWCGWHSWGKRGHTSHIKCQGPSAAHSSEGLIIPELKDRAEDSFPRDCNQGAWSCSCRRPELIQAALHLGGVLLREPSTDHISIRPQYSSQGSLVSLLALTTICNSILILSPGLTVPEPSRLRSVEAGPPGLSPSHLAHSAWRCWRNRPSIDGRLDDEYQEQRLRREWDLLRKELVSQPSQNICPAAAPVGSAPSVLGIWRQLGGRGCLCCLPEGVRSCGRGHWVGQPDRICPMGMHRERVPWRSALPLA